MEYNNVKALVPEGEHFDSSAVNEGVWMSEAHLGSVENALASNATTVTEITGKYDAEVARVQAAETSLATANQTIIDRDATIAAKDAEIVKLKAGPAAPIKETTKEGDDLGTDAAVESDITREGRKLRAMRDGK